MDKAFLAIYTIIQKNKLLGSILFIALLGVLIFSSASLKFDENIDKLIPQNEENKTFQEVLKNVNFSNQIILNISVEDSGTVDDATSYATKLIDSLEQNSGAYIKHIRGKIAGNQAKQGLDFVYDNLPIFLESQDYNTLSNRLKESHIDSVVQAYKSSIKTSLGLIMRRYTVRDPLNLSYLGVNNLREVGSFDDFVIKNGYLFSKDTRNLFLFIDPNFANSDTGKSKYLINELYRLQKILNSTYKNKATVSYYGGPLIANVNALQIQKDVTYTLGLATVLLLLVFIIFYKKWAIPFIVFIPTLTGGLLAATILSILRPEISAISLGIGAVLMGVTLDYALHILTHLRNNGSIKLLYTEVTKPILMSSLTTSLAFFCLYFIKSTALQDLGIFAGTSVLSASVFALIIVPQLYKPTGRHLPKKTTVLDRLAAYNFHKNKVCLSILAILVLIAIFKFNKVDFEKNIDRLNYISPALKASENKLDSLTSLTTKALYFAAYSDDEQIALSANYQVYKTLHHLKQKDEITSYNSLGITALPINIQQQKIREWNQFWKQENDQLLKHRFSEKINKYKVKPHTFDRFFKHLDQDFKTIPLNKIENLESVPLHDFITRTSKLITITSIARVTQNQMEKVKEHFKDKKHLFVIDRKVVNENLLTGLKSEFNKLLVYSLFVVVLILLIAYRNIKLVLVTLVPLLLTWFITLGLMGLFQLSFNVFNIIITSFIFGLGIDYGIFITHSLQHSTTNIATPKASILLSVLTTLLGFGVLIFAKHPALHSIAYISIIGILTAVFTAFTLQPILYKTIIKRL